MHQPDGLKVALRIRCIVPEGVGRYEAGEMGGVWREVRRTWGDGERERLSTNQEAHGSMIESPTWK